MSIDEAIPKGDTESQTETLACSCYLPFPGRHYKSSRQAPLFDTAPDLRATF